MDLNTLSGVGGFAQGLAGGLQQGLSRAEARNLRELMLQAQAERETSNINERQRMRELSGEDANMMASSIAGKEVAPFDPKKRYDRQAVDTVVKALKPSAKGGITGSGLRGLSGILGKFITTADNNRLSAVEPAVETHNTLVDLWNAYQSKDLNGQSQAANKLLTIMRSEAARNPNVSAWVQSQNPDPKNIPAMYEMSKRFAAAETNKLISGSIATPSEEGLNERVNMYPALTDSPTKAQQNFNTITSTQILGGIRGIKDKMNIWKEIPDVAPYATGFQKGLENYETQATKRIHNIQGFDVRGGYGRVPEVAPQQENPNILKSVGKMLAPKPTTAPTPFGGGGAFGGSHAHLWGD